MKKDYSEIMEAIGKMQENKSAIVILENEDGSTTYLRHKISQEDTAALIRHSFLG